MTSHLVHHLCLAAAGLVAFANATHAQRLDPKLYSELRWRFIGPDGNRVIAVAGEPGESRVSYAGAASGGLFKSTDGGTHWEPLTDSLPFSSVGSIEIAPSDHNVLYIGTGETFIRSNVSIGDGIWRSTDAGKTWTHVGLDNTGRIGRIVVDPRDARVLYAAALGSGYGAQQERGVYRSRDGGATWTRVLFVNDSTGASDIAIDAHDPNVLLAGMWQFVIHPWSVESGGRGSGVFQSRDGGSTWRRLTDGLPREAMGKIAIQIARRDPNRMYALIETKDPGLYRSDDGGRRWRLVNQDHDFLERPHYYTRFAVAPDDENRLYFVSVRFSWSLDGGLTKAPNPPRAGGDLHDIWIDPDNADRMMVGDDAGVGRASCCLTRRCTMCSSTTASPTTSTAIDKTATRTKVPRILARTAARSDSGPPSAAANPASPSRTRSIKTSSGAAATTRGSSATTTRRAWHARSRFGPRPATAFHPKT